jgi:hypothetical protein
VLTHRSDEVVRCQYGGGSRGGGRRRRRRGARGWLSLPAAGADDADELHGDLLHSRNGGGLLSDGGLGVDDANVGENIPRQPPTVEVIRLWRIAVRHVKGREWSGERGETRRGRVLVVVRGGEGRVVVSCRGRTGIS